MSMQELFKIPPSDLGRNSSPVLCWSRDARYVAAYGNNNVVIIYDRSGNLVYKVPTVNPKFMEWDMQSKYLIITSASSNEITVFHVSKKDVMPIEAPFCPTWIKCSRRGSLVAAGSDKGKFWICDVTNRESQTYQGTHDNAIIDGCWNSKSQLALCSEDQSISISNVSGSVIARFDIGDIPISPHFITVDQNLTLVFAGQKNPALYFWEYTEANSKPTRIQFDASLGKIIKCTTLSNSLVYVQFSGGKFLLVSFDSEIIVQRYAFPSSASHSDAVHSKAFVGSGRSVKLINLDDPKNIIDEQVRFNPDEEGDITSVSITADGTIGAVGVDSGYVHVFLLEVPILSASSGPLSVFSKTLTSLFVYDMHKRNYKTIELDNQPQKLGVCLTKVAMAFNNKIWFYDSRTCEEISNVEMSSTVESVQVSDTAFAVQMGGKVMLNYFDESKRPFNFPDFDTSARVTAFALTGFLLLLATDDGAVRIFNTRNQAFLDGYKHPVAITSIRANLSETRFVFIDAGHRIFIFNPIKRTATEVSSEENTVEAESALFDISDRNVFAVIAPRAVAVYHFTDHDVNGPSLRQIARANIGNLKAALGLSNGNLIYLDPQSQEQSMMLGSHSSIGSDTPEAVRQLLTLHRHRAALQVALKIGDKALLKEVGDSAVAALAVEIAAEAYAAAGESAKYNVMEPVMREEEYAYLKGYVSMLNRDFNDAQKSFLESSRPQMALDMRASLLQYDSALTLAERFDTSRIPQLSLESARQNELTGNYAQALQQYKVSLKTKSLAKASRSGIIRCLILAGKVEQGMKQLEKTHDTALVLECARILERLSAFSQAAQLYSQAQQHNPAAQCFLRANDLKSAADLIPKVDDSKVLRSIGMQLERNGQLDAAATAFERANEWESLVRVYLKINLDRATAIARAHPTVAACRLVAEHCIQLGNFRYAIEFLIIAGRSEDAFRVAELHQRMDELAELIGDKGTEQQYEALATYFCARNEQLQAAKFFDMANDPGRAMNCYMADGSDAAMDGALDLAEKVNDRELRDELLEFLTANKTNDLRYLLRMFIIMKQFDEAAETATRISDDLRNRGDYRASQDLIFDIIRQLQKHNYPVPMEMRQNLMIVHSYLLVKPMRQKDRLISSLLLRRISKYISKFPSHAAKILTMTVAECARSGLKKSSYEAATKLIAPEYEAEVPPDLMKKIVQTVRRKNLEEADEPKSKCPVCGTDVPISELYCGSCKTNIPFDSITGMHMTKEDWCECPSCHFPASHSKMCEEKKCPMCGEEISLPTLVSNPRIY